MTEDEVILMATNKLGKERSRLGVWLDDRGISQHSIGQKAKVSKNTMSNLCAKDGTPPSGTTMGKVLKVLREIDPLVRQEDFWSF